MVLKVRFPEFQPWCEGISGVSVLSLAMAEWVKDPECLELWCRLQLRFRSDPWSRELHMPKAAKQTNRSHHSPKPHQHDMEFVRNAHSQAPPYGITHSEGKPDNLRLN